MVRQELTALGVDEACDYVLHHLRAAGGDPNKMIDESALESIARGTQGVPRLLNQAMHQALTLAESANLPRLDAEAALEALALLGLSVRDEDTEVPLRVVDPVRRTA